MAVGAFALLEADLMGMSEKDANQSLEALIGQAGYSHAGLARRVNELGAAQGLGLRYDKTSVARWIRGQQPRGAVPGLLTEVFSRRLGRPVTLVDVGLADASSASLNVGLDFPSSTSQAVEVLTELWRGDVNRRDFLLNANFAAAALVVPSRDWLVNPPDPQLAHDGARHVGRVDVEAVRATGQLFRRLDNRFGGGHARQALVQYLNTDIAEMINGSYTDAVGRELFGAAAELTRLAGWMAYDIGLHGLAQRHFIQALRLAQAAGDRVFGGYVLATMSRQATYLGHGREAVQLGRAASHGAGPAASPTARAIFHAVQARGHGVLGEQRECVRSLRRAEGALGESAGAENPDWATFFDEAQLYDEFGHCFRDLGEGQQAVRFAERSLSLRAEGYARSRAFCQTVLAVGHLQRGDLEAGCAVGTDAVRAAGKLRSVRGAEYIRDLQRRFAPHRGHPLVRAFDARAGELLGGPRGPVLP